MPTLPCRGPSSGWHQKSSIARRKDTTPRSISGALGVLCWKCGPGRGRGVAKRLSPSSSRCVFTLTNCLDRRLRTPFLSSTKQKPGLRCQRILICLLRRMIFENAVSLRTPMNGQLLENYGNINTSYFRPDGDLMASNEASIVDIVPSLQGSTQVQLALTSFCYSPRFILTPVPSFLSTRTHKHDNLCPSPSFLRVFHVSSCHEFVDSCHAHIHTAKSLV